MNDGENSNRYRHIFKYISLFGSVQGLTILLSVVRNKIATVLLGAQGLGMTSLFNATVKLISDASSLGLGVSAVKHVSSHFDSGDERMIARAVMLIRSWSLVAALLGMSVCLVLSPCLDRLTFDWGDHTLHFMFLSLVVFMTAITVGELAILKGTRRMAQLAKVSVYTVVAGILISTPLYWFFGMSGIVPSLILIALAQMAFTVGFSYRLYPLRLSFSRELLGEGVQMVRLGLVFVIAGVLASATDFIIRSYFTKYVSLDMAGLYNSGYMLVFVYGGMVFTSMDSDYFPRLSGIKSLGAELNRTISQQIEVSLLMVGPMAIMLIFAMPIVIPLLFKSDFLIIRGMVQVATLSLLLRSVYLPMEYISLSRGDARTFFVQELFSCLMLLAGVLTGYHFLSMTGMGIGILVGSLLELGFVTIYSRLKYDYTLSRRVVCYGGVMGTLGALAYASTFIACPWMYWGAGVVLSVASIAFSWKILRTGMK